MGLKALGKNVIDMASNSIGSALEDSIKDYYRCEGLNDNTLMVCGTKIIRKGARNNSSDDVISDGSVFDVSAGQCAIILENGKIHDMVACFTDEGAGQYQFTSALAPSFFGTDKFSVNLIETFKNMAERFVAGGQATVTHKIIYLNLRPLKGMKAGTGGITFRDIEMNKTLEFGVSGMFSYSIHDPITFYNNCVHDTSIRMTLDSGIGETFHSNLKTALKSKLKSSGGVLNKMKITYDEVQGNTDIFIDAVNETLGESWSRYGVAIDTVGTNFEIDFTSESKSAIGDFQTARAYGSNNEVLRGKIVTGQLDAMNAAANNSSGAMSGFLGMGMMGMAQNNLGMTQMISDSKGDLIASTTKSDTSDIWKCVCGHENNLKFCQKCGEKKPEDSSWTCSCGVTNIMKFCGNCGNKKPELPKQFICNECGWKLEPNNISKFCPNCGDIFDEKDIVK